ncbi:hypothetical protein [Stappia sp. MMSF_3263]|uniref:hypothetical protein n=1 Tax=Stappia sp. MMSF_3263 TaxID=3046693 RepID=UPI00273D7D20|nr:hypothetical protein [Stappia sp. MMSF_3263]
MNESLDEGTGTRPERLRGIAWLLASPFFRLLAINWLIGAFVAVLVLGGLLWFDTGHLRSLMLASEQPWLPALVLLFGLMITLCSAAMGAAIMALPSGDSRSGGGGRSRHSRPLAPALVAVPARPRP